MHNNKRFIIYALTVMMSTMVLTGCKKTNNSNNKKTDSEDAAIIESEGDVEIIIPDDQEDGGF